MRQRGRKSVGALVVGKFSVTKIEAPAELNEEQGLVWREIVASQHSDWFNAGNMPLLVALCRHIVEERRLGDLIAQFDTEWLEKDEGLERYDLLTRNHDRQSKAIVALSRQLRLSNQARYRADKADTLGRRAPTLLEVPDEVEVDEDEPSG